MGGQFTTDEPVFVKRGAGIVKRVRDGGAWRSLAVDGGVLGILTAAVVAAYVWTKAPTFNPVPSVDPWLYTALWTNYVQIQTAFSATYYTSRLPWIVPGYLLNKVVDPSTAYYMIHVLFFLSGGLLLYVMCRRYFGRIAAACAYVGLIGDQLYFNAHRWDYVDGAILTFLLASFAFAIPKRRTTRIRAASLVLSGFFSAAVVTTRLGDALYLIGLPLVYWAVMRDQDKRFRLRRIAFDLAWYAGGALTLLICGGIFATRHDARFLFFVPQVQFLLHSSGGFKLPIHVWFPIEPYFFVPIFATVLGMLVLVSGRPSWEAAQRLLMAATAWSGATFVLVAIWEFAGGGWAFETPYYFSTLLLPSIFCLAGSIAGLLSSATTQPWLGRAAIGIVTATVIGPLLWIYRSDLLERTANGVWRGAYLTLIVIMIVALLVTVIALIGRSVSARVLAVGLAFLAFSFGIDASQGTWQFARSDPNAGATYRLGQKMIHFLHTNGFRVELPRFWYDAYDMTYGGLYSSLQSLYYYSYDFVGQHLPTIDADFRLRMGVFRPSRLVLLCSDPTCQGAPAALARAGFRSREIVHRRLNYDSVYVWIVIRSIQPARH
jgi:hypothetical protein